MFSPYHPFFDYLCLRKKEFRHSRRYGGYNSHSVLFVEVWRFQEDRSRDISLKIHDGDEVILDGNTGKVILHPNEEDLQFYRKEILQEESEIESLLQKRDEISITQDGKKVKISANIGLPVGFRV